MPLRGIDSPSLMFNCSIQGIAMSFSAQKDKIGVNYEKSAAI